MHRPIQAPPLPPHASDHLPDLTSTQTLSRPATRDGHSPIPPLPGLPQPPPARERKSSFSRKAASFSAPRRRGSSIGGGAGSGTIITDATAPPALPEYALSAAARVHSRDDALRSPASPDSLGRMLTRSTTASSATNMPPPPTPVVGGGGGSSTGNGGGAANGAGAAGSGVFWQPSDISTVHQQITDLASKRIATLDYLRKAHEGRVYWFNSYLFDKPDLQRMPFFDPRKLARKATNHLLLGLSIPVVADLYSSSPIEFLRSLSALLSEFDSFQQLRNDSSSALGRARIPQMFRRQGGKSRRSTSATDATAEEAALAMAPMGGAGGAGANGAATTAPSVMNFAASESELLPGEEYSHLLTPSLPFDPDYFETFSTLCDVLIDCYTRFLALVPTPRDCNATVAEMFTKADARVRKILVQGVVKDFEDTSRSNVKSEMASIGKVVLSGLM